MIDDSESKGIYADYETDSSIMKFVNLIHNRENQHGTISKNLHYPRSR